MESYSVGDVNLEVNCEDVHLGSRVSRALENHFFFEKNIPRRKRHHLNLSFLNKNSANKLPENLSEVFISPQFRILKNGDHCCLSGKDYVIQLLLSECCGTVYLTHDFWKYAPKSQQEVLMHSLLWLFHQHDLFSIHGNALVKDNVSILLVGDTCSGKTTISLGLILKGWKFLSDDISLIIRDQKRVKAIAFQKGFSFDPALVDFYPELGTSKYSSWNGKKKFMDITTIFPDKFTPFCAPNILIFPKIVFQKKSRLLKISKTDAMVMLMKNSGGIMVDKKMTSRQAEVLKNLIFQTESYQLLAGKDLYQDPCKISLLIHEN